MQTINLPCVVGDMLYQPVGTMVVPHLVKEIIITSDDILIKAINIRSEDTFVTTFSMNMIGKSVFLSKTEAIQKQTKDAQMDLMLEQQGGIL